MVERPQEEWLEFEYAGTSGERCDTALTLHLRALPEFAEVSRARVQALIEAGGVLINGRETYAAHKCRPGIRMSVSLPQLRQLLRPLSGGDIEPVDLQLKMHYVDEHLAVVEKPPGISVHPSPTEAGPTLAGALLHEFGQLSDAGGVDRPGIVHRLDKETTGLLVVARDNPTHVALSNQFARRVVEKVYIALTISDPQPPSGRIDLPIERHPHDRKRMWACGMGRPAQTEYELAEHWGPLAKLRIEIHSGRTHQIRVHLETVRAAILNDFKYGAVLNGALRSFLRKGGAPRGIDAVWGEALDNQPRRAELLALLEAYPGIFLHAHELRFVHPQTGLPLQFTSPPPPVWDMVNKLVL